jgi:thiamine transporter ThiT
VSRDPVDLAKRVARIERLEAGMCSLLAMTFAWGVVAGLAAGAVWGWLWSRS